MPKNIFIVEAACVIASLLFYAAMLLTQKRRREKVRASADNLILKTATPLKKKTRALWIVIPIVLVVTLLVNYSAFFVILMSALCSLGVFISCREDACNVNSGVYTNALIAGGEIIPYNKIKSINARAGIIPENLIMEIEFVDTKKICVQFSSAEEYACAAREIEVRSVE